METNEKGLKPEESLKIINDMISSAKINLNEYIFYFMFWGYTIAILSLMHFITNYFNLLKNPELVWTLVVPGMIICAIYGYRTGRKKKTFSHIDKIHTFTWIAFIISYIIIIVFGKEVNYKIAQLIFILAGMATFISGFVLKFRPLIIGAIVFWLGAILSFIIPSLYVPLAGFFILITGYLIPGYMLKNYAKKNA